MSLLFSTPRASRVSHGGGFHRSGTPGSIHRRVASGPELLSPPMPGNADSDNVHTFITSIESVLKSSPYGLGNELTELVLKLSNDEFARHEHLESATARSSFLFRNKAVSKLQEALEVSKELVKELMEANNEKLRALKKEIEDVKKANTILETTNATTIPTADDLLKTIMAVSDGSKPPKITPGFLNQLFDYNGYDMQKESSGNLAVFLHVDTWESIEALDAEEAHSILNFMSRKHFVKNDDFRNNLAFYNGILGDTFLKDMVMGSKIHTKETLHGLLGIYFRKVPQDKLQHTFNPRKKAELKDCWVPKEPTASTFMAPINDVHELMSENFAKQCDVATWHAIERKNANDAYAILNLMNSNGFSQTREFTQNIDHYISRGILGANFPKDKAMGSPEHTLGTLHSLIGIYLRKLPEEALQYTFTPRKNGEAPEPWVRKELTTAAPFGIASSGNPPSNQSQAPSHEGANMEDDDL